MSRNQYLQLYLETNNQIYRAKEKNQQCGLSNPQSHMDKTKIDRDVCMPAQHTGRRYLHECGGLHGQTSASNCSVQNLSVTWGPLQFSQPFVPQPQGWCNSMQLYTIFILCDCISGLFTAETVGFSLELPSALFWSEFVAIAGSARLRFAVDFVLLKPRPVRAGLAFAVFPTENVKLKQLQFSLLQI